MGERREYHDVRSQFWREHFNQAQDYDTYLRESNPTMAEKWLRMGETIASLLIERIDRLKNKGRRLNVLVSSGVWCGDCVRQGPMLEKIADVIGGDVDLRFIDREASAELTDELRLLGAKRVPVVVFLTDEFFEIGRFGDRLLSYYRTRVASELGAACETGLVPPPADQLQAELNEWVDIFERVLLMARLSPYLRQKHGD